MAFEISQTPHERGDTAAPTDDAAASEFRISERVIVADESVASKPANDEREIELPRSYATPLLCLMPRDARSLFAYWDIDWSLAFRDAAPPDRQVHLRVLDEAGAIESTTAVEPMKGSCAIDVASSDASYRGEVGWFNSAGGWVSLAISEPVKTPADRTTDPGPMELTTVPFHLTFQRMLEVLRVPKLEHGALTQLLSGIQERAATEPSSIAAVDPPEQELIRAIAAAQTQRPHIHAGTGTAPEPPINRWTETALKRALGFAAASPTGGFSGSSRHATS